MIFELEDIPLRLPIFSHIYLMLSLVLIINPLTGCNNLITNRSELSDIDLLSLESRDITKKEIIPELILLQGEIVIGHEMSMISPCGSSAEYWLVLPPSLLTKTHELISTPYRSVYGEVIGSLSTAPKEGFASDFSAVFNATDFNLISSEIDGCNRKIPSRIAFGQEPSWTVSLKDNTLTFNQLGQEPTKHLVKVIKRNKKTLIYKTKDMTLTLRNEICTDTMSDTIYGWRSTLAKDNLILRGCARLSDDERKKEEWSGVYQNPQTQTAPTLTLTLHPDHLATVQYEIEGDTAIKETGVWQPIEKNKVHVITNIYQNQYSISERILNRDGITLSTELEITADNSSALKLKSIPLSRLEQKLNHETLFSK